MLSINLTYQPDAAMKTEIPHDTQKRECVGEARMICFIWSFSPMPLRAENVLNGCSPPY